MRINVFDLLLICSILHCLETIHDGIAVHFYRVPFGFEVTSNTFYSQQSTFLPCKVTILWLSSNAADMNDDVIKWKQFLHYWPFVRGIHQSPVNSTHKGQWCEALMFSLICAWIPSWVNNHGAGDLRCHHAHYDVIVMICCGNMELNGLNWGLKSTIIIAKQCSQNCLSQWQGAFK